MAYSLDEVTITLVVAPPLLLLFGHSGGPISRLTTKMNERIQIGRKKLGLYSLVSYFGCLGAVVYFVLQFMSIGSQNVVAFHVTSGHWISEVAMVGVIVVYGYKDFIRGVYAAAFLFCIHEAAFLVLDGVYLGRLGDVLGTSWPLMSFYVFMLAGYFVNFRVVPRRTEVLIMAMLAAFYVLWWSSGFSISSANFLGIVGSNHIDSQDVNLNEILGWILPSLAVILRGT